MKPYHLLSAIFILITMNLLVQAQGIIIPRPCMRPEVRCVPPPQIPERPLKIKSIQFKTKITDQVAVTHIEQVFENDTPFVLEGIYFFPLPENVSITEFAMWDGDKRLVGEARSKQDARRIYNEIVRSRRDPGLLEYVGKNLFQASVFPIQPYSDKKIELTYSQVLNGEGGTVAYRYPLGIGWQANGFVPPPPRPVPFPHPRDDWQLNRQSDGSQGRPVPGGQPGPMTISGMVEIISRVAIRNIYSPSHEIDLKRDGERKARLSFESRLAAHQQDFQLFYSFSDQEFGLSLLTHREPGKDGYFMILVSPRAELDEREVSAKEVIFVLDTSGSMAEEGKMDQAKSALRYGVNTLNSRDHFNIVSFAGEEHLLAEKLIPADDSGKKQALEFIERMKPAGGTNINDALLAAFKQMQASERPQMVVLVTDGQPTVGETKINQILANAKKTNSASARLFTFGVGYDVNTVLLDGLANENRGAVGYIEPKENIEVKISNFFTKVNHPVLSDVKIDWGGVETDLIYPRTLPDIFHGSQLVLIGRYRASKRASVNGTEKPAMGASLVPMNVAAYEKLRLTLSGKVNGRDRRFVYEDLSFPDKQSENDFLPHLWAMRRVGHLLDQIRLNGESKELRDEIVELGTRYGIVTPYTSYLVIEPGMQIRNLPVNGRITHSLPMMSPPAMTANTGREAVIASKETEKLRSADKAEAAGGPRDAGSVNNQIRQVAGRTFYLLDGVWTDSEYKTDSKLPVVALKFASDEFFTLAGQESKLAECFALGKSVVVVWKGKVYRVVAE